MLFADLISTNQIDLIALHRKATADLEQIQELDLPDAQRHAYEVIAVIDFVCAAATQLSDADPRAGIQGIPEPSEKTIYRRRVGQAQQAARSLTMLMPPVNGQRQLSHETAVQLILNYGQEQCIQTAMQVNMEAQMTGKIRNPVGLLISRLRQS